MKFKEWNEIAELVGIAAVVGSLIFVGLQMKQSQDIAEAERRMLFIANRIELGNSINEHADIWLRGTTGEELDVHEMVVFENLMKSMADYHYFSHRAAQYLGNDFGAEFNVHEFAAFLHDRPGARRVWNAHEDEIDEWRRLLMPHHQPELGGDWVEVVRSDWKILDQARN